MAQMKSCLVIVVKPCLGVSGSSMGSHVHVKFGGSMQVWYGDHAVHRSFERCESIMEFLIKGLSAVPSEVSDEQARAFWALCQASYPDQLCPYGVECPFEPIGFVCVLPFLL